MRRFVIAIVVLLAVLVAADFGLRLYTQQRVGTELAASLSLPERPSVSLGGFPFLVHFAQGEFPTASADGTNLSVEGFTFRDVRLDLRDVTFEPGRVLGGDPTEIRARSGDGAATLTAQELTAAFRDRGAPVTVRIEGTTVRIESDQFPVAVEVTLAVEDGQIRVGAAQPGIPLSLSLPIPVFVEGLTPTAVEVRDSAVVISFRLDRPSFPIG